VAECRGEGAFRTWKVAAHAEKSAQAESVRL